MTEIDNGHNGIHYLYRKNGPSLDDLQRVRLDLHNAVELVLGFSSIGSMPSHPNFDEMGEEGVTREIYEEVFNALARIRMKYDPESTEAFGTTSPLKIPERFQARSDEMKFGKDTTMWDSVVPVEVNKNNL
jgi:hypothetical protein